MVVLRTIITIFLLICFLVLLIVGESFYVGGFCRDFIKEIKNINKNFSSQQNLLEHMNHMISVWDSKKEIIFVFANHNSFQEIETGIYNLQFCIKNNNLQEAKFYLDSLYHRVIELGDAIKFSSGNIF